MDGIVDFILQMSYSSTKDNFFLHFGLNSIFLFIKTRWIYWQYCIKYLSRIPWFNVLFISLFQNYDNFLVHFTDKPIKNKERKTTSTKYKFILLELWKRWSFWSCKYILMNFCVLERKKKKKI